jgi:hypothetical protein
MKYITSLLFVATILSCISQDEEIESAVPKQPKRAEAFLAGWKAGIKSITYTNQLQELLIESKLSTNWLPMSISYPNGDGTSTPQQKEIGVVMSNRYARVIVYNQTNTMLLSSEVMKESTFLLRDKTEQAATNLFGRWTAITNLYGDRWWNNTTNFVIRTNIMPYIPNASFP